MRNRRAYWVLIGVGFGFFTLSATGSAPTFSFKLGGINGEMFREIACLTDADCPMGSSCTLTEMTFPGNFELRCAPIAEVRPRCVGGTTPGEPCNTLNDCGGLGQCRGLVEPGDDIIVEAYLSGWDVEPDMGICNNGDECTLALNDCTQKHCSLSGQLCFTDQNCPDGQRCEEDECAVGPLLGAYQWTLDCRSFASTTAPYAGRLMHTVLRCDVDEDCRHGFMFRSQCTCAAATCNSGVCSIEATAYFELINFEYVYRDFSHEKLIYTDTCNYVFAGAGSRGGKPDDLEEKYVGTMWLTAPMDAYGTYEVNFLDDLFLAGTYVTFVNDSSPQGYPRPNLEPLVIEFPDPCADVAVVNSVPPHEGSLWRAWKNIARIMFERDLPSTPTPGQVEIVKLLPGGAFGPDLSASFTLDVEEGKVLRIQDTGATLQHRKWYAIRNEGNWPGVAAFEIQYVVQMGDCDGNGIVISLDVGCVNAGIPCFENCGDDNRKDMDGDDRVLSLDVGVVNAHMGSFTVPKPTGH